MDDNEKQKPEIKIMFSIGVDKDNVVHITGDLNNKQLCYHLLAQAINILADYKPVISPGLLVKNQMLNFARKLKR